MPINSARATITRPANATQYAAGDVIASAQADTLRFSSYSSGTVTIRGAMCVTSANQAAKPDIDLYLFTSTLTTFGSDNGAFTPTDAEMLTCCGFISFPGTGFKAGDATVGATGNAVCQVTGLEIAVPVGGGHAIYGVPVAQSAYTPITGEVINFVLHLET